MKAKLESWLNQRITACAQRRAELNADFRQDEARFEQIRENVYGIFRSVCQATDGMPDTMIGHLEKIPAAWEAQHALALQHHQEDRALIERIKLETAEEIRRFVCQLKEGAH